LSAFLKATNDFIAFRQIIDLVSTGRMRCDRKNLAVDAKTADAVGGAEPEGSAQCVGIFPAETAQLRQGVRSLHLADGRGCRLAEPWHGPLSAWPSVTAAIDNVQNNLGSALARPIGLAFHGRAIVRLVRQLGGNRPSQ